MSDALVYQTKAIKALEKHAIAAGITEIEMMERAATAACQLLVEKAPQAQHFTVFCGPGNNGGDGLMLARLLKAARYDVHVVFVGHVTSLTPATKIAWEKCKEAHVEVITFSADAQLPETDVIIDALLGTGLSKPLTDNFLVAVNTINAANKPVLALDVPTGLHADTGVIIEHAVKVTWTITFIGRKVGLFTGSGPEYVGDIICDALDFPAEFFTHITPSAQLIAADLYKTLLPPRHKDSHKGSFGHVIIVGGNHGMTGAPRMAAAAAARAGAGRVSVATRAEYAPLVNADIPELLSIAMDDPAHIDIEKYHPTFMVIGPGLGHDAWADAIMKRFITLPIPLLIDADGLRWLAKHPHKRDDWILTPHPGEAAALLHATIQEVQHHRLAAAQAIQHKYGGTVILKGVGSIVSTESPTLPAICYGVGNPGMASAGMGDSLCGIIAALAAQHIALPQAATAGVWLHAKAADLAAAEQGERGLLASDLLPFLHRLVNASSMT